MFVGVTPKSLTFVRVRITALPVFRAADNSVDFTHLARVIPVATINGDEVAGTMETHLYVLPVP